MTQADPVRVSESAAQRIRQMLAQRSDPALRLRITVSGGGCSGFKYDFSLDPALGADDHVFGCRGAQIVVDAMSLPLLLGAQLDYVEDLANASFQIRNPNAKSSCGCGNSFALA